MSNFMPNTEDLVKKAQSYLKKRNFSTLAYYLTAKVPLFGEHAELYYYLGLAQLHLKNLKAAHDYFQTGMLYDPEHIELKLAAAVTALRQRDTSAAVRLWLEVLDIDPDNKKAHKGLNILRKIQTPTEIARFIRRGGTRQLEPTLPSYITPLDGLLILAGCILLALTIILGIRFSEGYFFPINTEPTHTVRAGAEKYNITSLKKKDYLQRDKTEYLLQLSPQEIRKIMNQAKEDFNNYKDNKVRFELNKIRYSNASAAIKAQASVLTATLNKPNFTNLDTNFTYRDVFSNPSLYHGVYVNWRGKVQDVQFTAQAITFFLLVGYDEEKVLEGRVLVNVPFETFIDPILPTEVLGQIMMDENQQISILASSIHQIIRP